MVQRNLGEKKTILGMSVTSLDWHRDKPGNRYAEPPPDKALRSCDSDFREKCRIFNGGHGELCPI